MYINEIVYIIFSFNRRDRAADKARDEMAHGQQVGSIILLRRLYNIVYVRIIIIQSTRRKLNEARNRVRANFNRYHRLRHYNEPRRTCLL